MFLVGILVQRTNPRYLLAFGFAMFAVSSLLLSRLTLDVSMRNIVTPNVLNGFGSGFIFRAAGDDDAQVLRNNQIKQHGGHPEPGARSVGGSISAFSFISTMLVRYAQAHQVFWRGASRR